MRITRHAHKTTSRRQDGFKAHVVAVPDTGLVTACAVTKAAGEGSGDAAAGQVLLATDSTVAAAQSVQVLGDSAYGTGSMLAALHEAGHQALVKPWPVNPAVPGGFTVDDFTVDHAARTVTCPAGTVRPGRFGRSTATVRSTSVSPAGTAPCGSGAPAAAPGRRCGSVNTTPSNAPTDATPPTRPGWPITDGTGRWSNGPSPGSPAATGNSATAAPSRTTPGSTSEPERSTSAGSWPSACTAAPEDGRSPEKHRQVRSLPAEQHPATGHRGRSAALPNIRHHQSTQPRPAPANSTSQITTPADPPTRGNSAVF
jgi:hypothetical protein